VSAPQPAEGSLRVGAVMALREAFSFVEQSGDRFWLAELHRLNGQVVPEQPQPDRGRAEARFVKAIEIAHQREARMLELLAGIDLARLWQEASVPNDPRTLLEPILAAIEGGETTRDVRNARAAR
jgi:predicted ATPase